MEVFGTIRNTVPGLTVRNSVPFKSWKKFRLPADRSERSGTPFRASLFGTIHRSRQVRTRSGRTEGRVAYAGGVAEVVDIRAANLTREPCVGASGRRDRRVGSLACHRLHHVHARVKKCTVAEGLSVGARPTTLK